MKRALIISVAITLFFLVGPSYGASTSLCLSYGNNVWGSTVGGGFSFPMSDRWSAGIAYSSGYFNFVTRDGDFLMFSNLPGDEHHVTLELNQMVDIAAYYERHQASGLRFLGRFGLGLSHVFVRFKSEFTRDDIPGTMRAQRDYSLYGLFGSLTVIDFEPPRSSHMLVSLGIKGKLCVMEEPEELYYTDGVGRIEKSWLYAKHGTVLYFPYPELFVGLTYRF